MNSEVLFTQNFQRSAKDLSLFTGNVPINFDHIGPIMTGDHNIYKGFEKLINHPRFFNGRPVNPSIIKEFLKKSEVKSNNKWLTRAQTEMATSKNCKSFLSFNSVARRRGQKNQKSI